jgi:hypothetical protein
MRFTGTDTDAKLLAKYQPLAEQAFPKPGHTRQVTFDRDALLKLSVELDPLGFMLLGEPRTLVRGRTMPDVGGDFVELLPEQPETDFAHVLFHEYAHTVGVEHGPHMAEVVRQAMESRGLTYEEHQGDDPEADWKWAQKQMGFDSEPVEEPEFDWGYEDDVPLVGFLR